MKSKWSGVVFAIDAGDGEGLFQALFPVPRWGYWIKVFAGTHSSPQEPSAIARMVPQFYAFFPLEQAVKRGVVKPLGVAPIDKLDMTLPPLKTPGGVSRDGTVTDWFIIEGNSSSRVKKLTPAQERLQEQMVINDTALREMISEGWRPETSVQVLKSR